MSKGGWFNAAQAGKLQPKNAGFIDGLKGKTNVLASMGNDFLDMFQNKPKVAGTGTSSSMQGAQGGSTMQQQTVEPTRTFGDKWDELTGSGRFDRRTEEEKQRDAELRKAGMEAYSKQKQEEQANLQKGMQLQPMQMGNPGQIAMSQPQALPKGIADALQKGGGQLSPELLQMLQQFMKR